MVILNKMFRCWLVVVATILFMMNVDGAFGNKHHHHHHASGGSNTGSFSFTCPNTQEKAKVAYAEMKITLSHLTSSKCSEEETTEIGKMLQQSLEKSLDKRGVSVYNAHQKVCPVPLKQSVDNELDSIIELSHSQEGIMNGGDLSSSSYYAMTSSSSFNNNNAQHDADQQLQGNIQWGRYIYAAGFKGLHCPEKKEQRLLRSRNINNNNKNGKKMTKQQEKHKKKKHCLQMDKNVDTETFAKGTDVSSWENGKLSTIGDYQFLGPYEKRQTAGKTFQIAKNVDLVIIKFDFMELGKWTEQDYLGITIGTEKFGLKNSFRRQHEEIHSGHTKGGVAWAVKGKPYPNKAGDNTIIIGHRVVIHVPENILSSNSNRQLLFGLTVMGKSGGMDNFQLVSRTSCSLSLPKPKEGRKVGTLPEDEVEEKLNEYLTKELRHRIKKQHCLYNKAVEAHVHVYSKDKWEDAMPQCQDDEQQQQQGTNTTTVA